MITLRSDSRFRRPIVFTVLLSIAAFTGLTGGACKQAADAPTNSKSTPANVTATAKPTEAGVKQPDPKPAGKEIKAADGPALKSIIPPEGAILGGVLNGIAASLPAPDTKGVPASGTVTVEVMVNEKGEVVATSAVSGPQPLWSAAVTAARQAKFDPPLHDGKPVKVAGVLTYEFGK